MHTFYAPDISPLNYSLNKEEARHAVSVLRLKKGDRLQLIDGRGGWYLAEITDANGKSCSVTIIEKKEKYGKRDYYLHLAVSPTKNSSRYEWFVEKATEIGVDEITPIICEHSERRIINSSRLEKVALAAMKQSVTAYHPKINAATTFNNFMKKSFNGDKFMGYSPLIEGTPLQKREHIHTLCKKGNNTLILIGPEGDFSNTELENAMQQSYQAISLGENRLRTETAAVAACYAVNLLNAIEEKLD